VEQVLQGKSYRTAAGKLSASIRQAGGVKRAADIVEQAISTQQPVLAHKDTKINRASKS
jgi:UDP:flavonoid glycosyltransferase YjiC (YdhE family)